MPIFDADIRVPVEIGYTIIGGQIEVDAVVVTGTGANLPLTDKMAYTVLELCRNDNLEDTP